MSFAFLSRHLPILLLNSANSYGASCRIAGCNFPVAGRIQGEACGVAQDIAEFPVRRAWACSIYSPARFMAWAMIICARQQLRNEICVRRQQKPDFVEIQKRSLPLTRNRPAVPVISGDFNRCRNMHPGKRQRTELPHFPCAHALPVPPDLDRLSQVPLRLRHVRSQRHESVRPQSQSQSQQA
jgi:hypothetical protein